MTGSESIINKLAGKRAVVVSRFRAPVPVINLVDFLKDRVADLVLIKHPFYFNLQDGSTLIHYQTGKVIAEVKHQYRPGTKELVLYAKSIWRAWRWLTKEPEADFYIGLGNLDAFAGVVLKKLGKVKAVIFYTIDYVPNRFSSQWVNRFYHWLDSYVVKKSDYVWNLSGKMVEMREQKGLGPEYRDKQLVVPIGTDPAAVKYDFSQINRYQLGYVGHLRAGQGVDFLIKLMPQVIARLPQATLLLIGGGEKEKEIRELASSLGLTDKIKFTGFVASQAEMEDLIARTAIALAPYPEDESVFTQYTDPGKIKTYLQAGLPVIMTDIAPIARIIEEENCGFALRFREADFLEKIVDLLKNDDQLRQFKSNAVNLSKEFDWSKIFSTGLEPLLNKIS